MRKIVIGVSGASGMPLAFTLLEALQDQAGLEVHLIVSDGAKRVLRCEGGNGPVGDAEHGPATSESFERLSSLAHTVYEPDDLGAAPASGSWPCLGMIICPCSMSSLGAIVHGCGSNLLHRAADVTIKEKRKLLIVPRETPLSAIHLRNMLQLAELGVTIMPPNLAFYNNPRNIREALRHFCGRILDQFAFQHDLCTRWKD